MPKSGFTEQTEEYIERFIGTDFRKVKHDHGGEFIACLDSREYVLKDDYLELIHELEDEGVDLTSVQIANIPKEE